MLNTKNYDETSGDDVLSFGLAANYVDGELKKRKIPVKLIVSPSAFSLGLLHSKIPRLTIYAQHVDSESKASTTGFLLPEIAKKFGATGSILNHSEHRLEDEKLRETISLLRDLEMKSLVCARDPKEVGRFARFSPDYIAIEPPELIGSGNAVSKSQPSVIINSRKTLDESRPSGSKTILLCGAGIVEGVDAQRAVELGAQGILVASGVVKAQNWKKKMFSLAEGLTFSGKEKRERAEK